MNRVAVALSCILLSTAALAQTQGQQSGPVSTVTDEFVRKVAISDLYEISAARLALAHGNDAERTFAISMLEDHGKTSSELKRVVANDALKIDMPSQLDDAHQAKLQRLNSARGQDFVNAYASQQVEAHKEAISLFENYARSGDHPELKSWAVKTVPALKHHLEMAEKLDASQPAAPSGIPTHK